MNAEDACKYVMRFGKYKGRSLEDIATGDPDGARYLDWMLGNEIDPEFKGALEVFLAIPWAAEMVDRALELRESQPGSISHECQ